jgi:hypothetical protein
MSMNLKVGQEVAARDGYSHKARFFGVVKKVTATGQSIVEFKMGEEIRQRRFNKYGKEIAVLTSYPDYLVADAAAERVVMANEERRIIAAKAINAIYEGRSLVRHTWSKDDLRTTVQGLEEQIAAARVAVEAI